MSHLLFHEIMHGLLAVPMAYIVWKVTNNKGYVVLLFVVTYLIDLDHLIDYFFFKGQILFNLNEFLTSDYFKRVGHIFVFLHGWEYVAIIGILSYIKKWNNIYLAIFLGLLIHLVWDSINVGSPLFYSIVYRASTGFALPN